MKVTQGWTIFLMSALMGGEVGLTSAAEMGYSRGVRVEWEAIRGAHSYELEWTRGSDCSEVVKTEKAGLSEITTQFEDPGLYCLRVRALDEEGKPGRWTKPEKVPVSPLAPTRFVFDGDRVKWEDVRGVESYEVEWVDPEGEVIHRSSQSAHEYVFPYEELGSGLKAGAYELRVRALRGDTPPSVSQKIAVSWPVIQEGIKAYHKRTEQPPLQPMPRAQAAQSYAQGGAIPVQNGQVAQTDSLALAHQDVVLIQWKESVRQKRGLSRLSLEMGQGPTLSKNWSSLASDSAHLRNGQAYDFCDLDHTGGFNCGGISTRVRGEYYGTDGEWGVYFNHDRRVIRYERSLTEKVQGAYAQTALGVLRRLELEPYAESRRENWLAFRLGLVSSQYPLFVNPASGQRADRAWNESSAGIQLGVQHRWMLIPRWSLETLAQVDFSPYPLGASVKSDLKSRSHSFQIQMGPMWKVPLAPIEVGGGVRIAYHEMNLPDSDAHVEIFERPEIYAKATLLLDEAPPAQSGSSHSEHDFFMLYAPSFRSSTVHNVSSGSQIKRRGMDHGVQMRSRSSWGGARDRFSEWALDIKIVPMDAATTAFGLSLGYVRGLRMPVTALPATDFRLGLGLKGGEDPMQKTPTGTTLKPRVALVSDQAFERRMNSQWGASMESSLSLGFIGAGLTSEIGPETSFRLDENHRVLLGYRYVSTLFRFSSSDFLDRTEHLARVGFVLNF